MISDLLFCALWPPVFALLCWHWRRSSWLAAGIGSLWTALWPPPHFWPAVASAVNVVIGVWILRHYNRKRRKRAPRAYGAKSRALLAALVRKARRAARPRPVLRPAPQPS